MINSRVFIRNIQKKDLSEIAKIHITSFKDRALTQLGFGAVRRYYSWLLAGFSETYPICVETPNGSLVGFCFAGHYSGSFSGFLRQHKWYLLSALLLRPWLIFNSLVRDQAKLALRTLRKGYIPRKSEIKQKNSSHRINQHHKAPSSLGILSIAVLPSYQRQGIGELMMEEVEKQAIAKNFSQLHLSVHPENLHAVKFYEKLGWERSTSIQNWDGKMQKTIR